MSADDLEKYETDMELQLYREYKDVVGIFKYVVETERRFYLCNAVDLKVRTEDAVFRQGGDEFAVIAPETDRIQAEYLGRRIEDAVLRVSSGNVQISASVGCAVFPHDGTEAGELLDSADAALLARKRTSVTRY